MDTMTLTPQLCGCGCGEYAKVDERRNRVSKYVAGHNARVAHGMVGRRQSDDTRAKIKAARAMQANVKGGGPKPRPPAERFAAFVAPMSSGCLQWTGSTQRHGYGAFGVTSHRVVRAHRFAYEQVHGPIPDGLEVDHLCNNRLCVNPEHLEAVTHAENIRRAVERRRASQGG